MDVQGLKVLVIDDSNTIRRTAETLLSKAGCNVATASDGFDSLAKIVDIKPDVIFVDIMMPRLNGFQATRQLSKGSETKHIPVIIVTAKNQQTDQVWSERQGARAYLVKPIDEKQLVSAIADVLA